MNPTASGLWLACAEDAQLVATEPCSLSMPSGLESGEKLLEMLAECGRVLRDTSAERVVILDPEPMAKIAFAAARARMTVETLLSLAAAENGIPCEKVSRARVRSALGLARSGKLADRVGEVVEQPLAPHWKAKRDLAALAALAIKGNPDAER